MRALQAGFKDYISILLFLKEASEPAGKRRGQQNKTKNLGGGGVAAALVFLMPGWEVKTLITKMFRAAVCI